MGALTDVGRTVRTLQYLDHRQWLALAAHQMRRRLPESAKRLWLTTPPVPTRDVDLGRWPALNTWRQWLQERFGHDAAARFRARQLIRGNPTFIGVNQPFGSLDRIDWGFSGHGRLWAYHLHYLDGLVVLAAGASLGRATDAVHVADLASAWARANPVGRDPAWEPYPVSLRLVNLIRAAVLLRDEHPALATELTALARVHADALPRMLETHLRANHLLANLKALVMASSLDILSCAFRRRGHRLLAEQLSHQFLPDGGHYERSLMYHRDLTEDMAELTAVLAECETPVDLVQQCRETTLRAATFHLAHMHPDGSLPLLNDTANGAAVAGTSFAEAIGTLVGAEVPRPEAPLTWSAASGLASVRCDPFYVCWDAGPIGPDDQPGHGHSDALSFELSVHGRRVITNRGIRGYADEPTRSYSRSTAAHSTFQFGSDDPHELWGAFRVGQRSRPEGVSVDRSGPAIHLRAALPWTTLRERAVHRREIAVRSEFVDVRDTAAGGSGTSRFHCAPGIEVTPRADGWMLGAEGRDLLRIEILAGDPGRFTRTRHFEGFGREVEAWTWMVPVKSTSHVRFRRLPT